MQIRLQHHMQRLVSEIQDIDGASDSTCLSRIRHWRHMRTSLCWGQYCILIRWSHCRSWSCNVVRDSFVWLMPETWPEWLVIAWSHRFIYHHQFPPPSCATINSSVRICICICNRICKRQLGVFSSVISLGVNSSRFAYSHRPVLVDSL